MTATQRKAETTARQKVPLQKPMDIESLRKMAAAQRWVYRINREFPNIPRPAEAFGPTWDKVKHETGLNDRHLRRVIELLMEIDADLGLEVHARMKGR